LAFHEPDWHWVQDRCEELSHHPAEEVRAISATCLGHLVRFHGKDPLAGSMKILKRLLKDKAIAGTVEDAIVDCEMFGKDQ
jgi:hypothetical protein